MTRLLALCATMLFCGMAFSQGFNGTIDFVYANQQDTTVNVYLVKDKMVKLNQYSRKKDKSIEGSFIFDLEAGEIKFLTPKRKLWGRQKNEVTRTIKGTCVVTQGKGVKTIAGIKCREVNVKNTEENTSITYWITDDKYTFFAPMLKLWNRPDKQSIYFGQIRDLKPGSMPLMSEERAIDTGRVLTRLEVSKITKMVPPDDAFMIPKDYSKLD
jgi:hypothetical protein